MSVKSITVRARIEPDLKKETDKIFDRLGLTTIEAIRTFFKLVQLHKGLPFEVRILNEETRQAFAEAQKKNKMKSFNNPDELFEDLGH